MKTKYIEDQEDRIQTRIKMIRMESRILSYKIEKMINQRKDLQSEKHKLKQIITKGNQ